MTVQDAIQAIVAGGRLSEDQAFGVAGALLAGQASAAQIGALLTALRIRGETVDEIAGFARAQRAGAVRVPVRGDNLVDPVGTGGDGLETFNISTAAAFVAAAAGCRVAKHGNRAISSRCGSADVLRALGVNIDAPPERMARCIDEIGVGFLFAPLYHPGMAHVMGPRRELAMRTIFNVLGPLSNPAGATRHVVGVYDVRLTEPIARVLGRLGSRQALVVHGADGLDEISLSGPTTVTELRAAETGPAPGSGSAGAPRLQTYCVAPEDFGLARAPLSAIRGGDASESAAILRAVLEGQPGPRRDIVLLNAGAAIYVAGRALTLAEGVRQAAAAIDSGAALAKLTALTAATSEGAA